jgi:outer membrane protein insertion porin family
MVHKIQLLFLITLFTSLPILSQINIVEIKFAGLEKTQESYLHNFIESKEDSLLDSATVINDVQRLHNLQLFKDVSYSIKDSPEGKIIEFNTSELFTLLPILNFGGVTDNFWFQIGAMDYNWLGNGYTLGGYYRYYDRHSFSVYIKAPYLFDNHWGLTTDLARFSTIEPAYFPEGVADYNVDHWNFISSFIYNFNLNNSIEFGGGYLYERYDKNEIQSGQFAPGPDFRDYHKILAKFLLHSKYINYNYQYLKGFSNELNLENVTTAGDYDLFWKILNISKLFIRPNSAGNLAFRLRLGISTNKDSPFVPFVLDNYINVRGSGNRVSRGTAEITLNSEYRHTVWESYWGAVQGVAFMDMSAWRPAAGKFSQMFEDKYYVTFGGLGIRFYFKKFNNFIFRLDYGKSVTGNKGSGIVFGAGQYF